MIGNTGTIDLPHGSGLYVGEDATIQGFGSTKDHSLPSEVLLYTKVPVITNKNVQEITETFQNYLKLWHFQCSHDYSNLKDTQLCIDTTSGNTKKKTLKMCNQNHH